jgi:hypothetical protein
MPGKKYASIENPKQYEALRKQGMSKEQAAKITNAQSQGGRKSGKGK